MPYTKEQLEFFDNNFTPENFEQLLLIEATEWIRKLGQSLEENNRVVTGALKQSMVPDVKVSPTFISIRVEATKGGEYWKVVDKGRGKGKKQPPHDAMLKHLMDRNDRYKPIIESIKNYYDKSQTKKRKTPLTDIEARNTLAFLLGRSIKEKGIKPTNFVSEAIGKDEVEALRKKIAKAVKDNILKR